MSGEVVIALTDGRSRHSLADSLLGFRKQGMGVSIKENGDSSECTIKITYQRGKSVQQLILCKWLKRHRDRYMDFYQFWIDGKPGESWTARPGSI